MATRKPRRAAHPQDAEASVVPKPSLPRDLWQENPHARTLADFQQLLNSLVKPSPKDLDELFQVVFGAAARPENRVVVTMDQLPDVYGLITEHWPKVNGQKSAAALAKRQQEAAATGKDLSVKRQRKPAAPVDQINSVIEGMATHTYRFHDARPASSQVCLVETPVRAPYVFGATVVPTDARLSPTYTSSALEHDKAALVEAEMMVDGQPFSLALDLAHDGAMAEALLADLGFVGVSRPKTSPPTGNGTVLIVQDERGRDLHLVPNVSVNVDRALNTARYRPGPHNTLAKRSRLFLVGGTQRQNAGMLNTMMGHPMVLQSLPWQPPLNVDQATRTLMSPRRPMATVYLNAETVAQHPMLQLRRGPVVEEKARQALGSLVERMLKPVTRTHEVLRNGSLSASTLLRIRSVNLPNTPWRQLLLGTLERQDVALVAEEVSRQVWALLERLPQTFEHDWTMREVERLIEAMRPRQPLL